MATYEVTAELNLKKTIDELREIGQIFNEFVNNLEQIEKKYDEENYEIDFMKKEESEGTHES